MQALPFFGTLDVFKNCLVKGTPLVLDSNLHNFTSSFFKRILSQHNALNVQYTSRSSRLKLQKSDIFDSFNETIIFSANLKFVLFLRPWLLQKEIHYRVDSKGLKTRSLCGPQLSNTVRMCPNLIGTVLHLTGSLAST